MIRMVKKIIYFVQQKIYYGYDASDDEDIEDCRIVGYFSSKEKALQAKQVCIDNNIPDEQIEIKEFIVELNNNQKSIYVVGHEFAIKVDDSYTDYTYTFEPLSNRNKCKTLIDNLKKEDKYRFSEDRCYDAFPPDGFVITKYELDIVWYPVYMKLK